MAEERARGAAVTRLLLLVEGESEELFVKLMLAPHLVEYFVYAEAVLVDTRGRAGGPKMGGGNHWRDVRKSLLPMLHQRDVWVTTLLDFYGLRDDFPGVSEARAISRACEGVALLEQRLAEAVDRPRRFIPFFAKHEFEAWYFAAPEKIESHFDREGIASQLAEVVRVYGGPEEINHGRATHPSARLEGLRIGFRKTREISLLEKIGIPAIRSACPHFAQWLSRLERLGTHGVPEKLEKPQV